MVEAKRTTVSSEGKKQFSQEILTSIPEGEREWVSDFMGKFSSKIHQLFRNYEYPRHRDFFAWVAFSQMRKREGSKLNFDEGSFRGQWRKIVGLFFEKMTLYYLERNYCGKIADSIVPGEIFPDQKIPDAFLVRKLDTCTLITGSLEFKFGEGYKFRMRAQLEKMESLKHHFRDSKMRRRLKGFIEQKVPVIVNPTGYNRRILVTPVEGHPSAPAGIETIRIPLTRRQISNLCAASLLDFSVSRQNRVKYRR